MVNKNIFISKKILIYGLGKSGLSSYFFLKKNNDVYLYDDFKTIIKHKKIKKLPIKLKNINKINFDYIVISPGININKCNIKNFLKKNYKKVITDLDIFYSHYHKNRNITITGTNGKSTTSKLLFEILKNQKKDVRLTGNIGNPILSEKKITAETIFIIEVSSYQIEYSKNFKANFAAILNISPDHLERHRTFNNYIKSKFKLIKNQTNKGFSFLNVNNKYFKKEIEKNQLNSQLINVKKNFYNKYFLRIKKPYFLNKGKKKNLSFVFAISKKIKLKKKKLFDVVNNFKGLKYRQKIIYKSKKITLINDSKATSYSSSVDILKSLKEKVYWIVGGIPKKGDKFLMLKKECSNFTAYIFGKNKNNFIKQLKNKIKYESFKNLKILLKKIILDIKLKRNENHLIILFSPSAASFDDFKNFEDRGEKFNNLVNKFKLTKK